MDWEPIENHLCGCVDVGQHNRSNESVVYMCCSQRGIGKRWWLGGAISHHFVTQFWHHLLSAAHCSTKAWRVDVFVCTSDLQQIESTQHANNWVTRPIILWCMIHACVAHHTAIGQGLQQIRIIFVFVFGNKPNSGIRTLFVSAAIFETNNIRICSICCCHETLLFAVFEWCFCLWGPGGAIWGHLGQMIFVFVYLPSFGMR